jgi:acyl carrier protein
MELTSEDYVRQVIAAHVAEVMPGVAAADVSLDGKLSDYGCNSLDRADIVSLAMETLGIDLPVTELTGLTNLRELAAAMCRHLPRG